MAAEMIEESEMSFFLKKEKNSSNGNALKIRRNEIGFCSHLE